MSKVKISSRYVAEALRLRQAVQGDAQAADATLQILSSTNPNLRQMLMATLHDNHDPALWERLLCCLALHRWQPLATPEPPAPAPQASGVAAGPAALDCCRRSDPRASERIDLALAEAFVIDEDPDEGAVKLDVLGAALAHRDPQLRLAAAYLLGLRGHTEAIPVLELALEELPESAPRQEWQLRATSAQPAGALRQEWQLRAITALAAIRDERSGFALVRALALGDERLHAAARHALADLGSLAEPAMLHALEHPDSHIRWHAARGLGQMGNPQAVRILAAGLHDPSEAVRWATARTLAGLDALAVPAVLELICRGPLDQPFRQAAYHALNHMTAQHVHAYLQPLLDSLHGPSGGLEAPLIAQRLLSEWGDAQAGGARREAVHERIPWK